MSNSKTGKSSKILLTPLLSALTSRSCSLPLSFFHIRVLLSQKVHCFAFLWDCRQCKCAGYSTAGSEEGALRDVPRDAAPCVHRLLCSGHKGGWFRSVSRPLRLQSTPWNSYTLFAQVFLSNVHLVLSRKVLRAKKERIWLYFFNRNILIRIYEIPINIEATYFFIRYSFCAH